MRPFGVALSVALAPAICGFAACGGKIDSLASDAVDASSRDAGRDTGIGGGPTYGFTDAGGSFDIDATAPSAIANGPDDTTPACASRDAIDCSCHTEDCPPGDEFALSTLIDKCNVDGAVCGFVYVDFDPNGCATALKMDTPDPKFVACMTSALDSEEWPCATSIDGAEVKTNVDCTTRGR